MVQRNGANNEHSCHHMRFFPQVTGTSSVAGCQAQTRICEQLSMPQGREASVSQCRLAVQENASRKQVTDPMMRAFGQYECVCLSRLHILHARICIRLAAGSHDWAFAPPRAARL